MDSLAAELIDSISIPITYIDESLVYRLCNRAAADALGGTADEIVGRSLASVVGENTHIYDAVRHVIETGEPFEAILNFRAPDGLLRNYEVAYVAHVREGVVKGAITSGMDVTDLIQAQLALQDRERRTDLSLSSLMCPRCLATTLRLDGNSVAGLAEDYRLYYEAQCANCGYEVRQRTRSLKFREVAQQLVLMDLNSVSETRLFIAPPDSS